ncbi:unnamed protein product [Brachionus calyciflorus]|uniref:Uncharacterized protein n=1 Tax=Brachionus calyciflorus TaxID=104777 RepID=A0A814PF37_9BILA|nr:unnamed protein product [Brachionus calyciflorus]
MYCTILAQFGRLFKLIEFKKDFENCDIELIVDNATTHTSKNYDINHFNKFPGTNCIFKTIEWLENDLKQSIDCVDQNGVYIGLLDICKKLG